MKYLKSYNDHSINEELTRTQRVWLNLPTILASFVGKLMGIHPLLNLRWSEIKKKTEDSKFDPIVATSGTSPSTMEEDLTEISASDIKASKIKIPMLLRGWNIYLSNRNLSHEKNRGIIYITKDTIKKGDRYAGERLSDRDVYPESAFNYDINKYVDKGKKKNFKIKDEFPAIIMIAKFEKEQESDAISQYMDDICLDIEDEFPISAEPSGNSQSDKFWILIDVDKEKEKELIFSENLDNRIKEVSNRILQYLKTEGKKGYKCRIEYRIKGPLYYLGKKGRFDEIIEIAEEYSRGNDSDVYSRITDSDGKKQGVLDVSALSSIGYTYIRSKRVDLGLNGDDIKTLLSDLDNCSKTYYLTNSPDKQIKQIEVKSIYITFSKD